ncbi:MAG: hypothetical protein COC10_13270 [Sphingobium sp.]|nr:MAG: hypothetical protein COC10_13270 [Sphingobium sp.]
MIVRFCAKIGDCWRHFDLIERYTPEIHMATNELLNRNVPVWSDCSKLNQDDTAFKKLNYRIQNYTEILL